MNILDTFAPDYDRLDVAELTEHDPQELLKAKYEAAHAVHTEEAFAPIERAAGMVQLLSLLNLEIPQFAHVIFKLDYESAVVFAVSLVDDITHATTEFAMSWAKDIDLEHGLPINRYCAVYSKEYLDWLLTMLSGEYMYKAVKFADNSDPKDALQHLDLVSVYLTAEAKESFSHFTGSVFATPMLTRVVRDTINKKNFSQQF